MAATQTGTDLILGCGTITGSYVVIERTDGDKDVDMEDFYDQDGARINRSVYQTDAKISLVLLCKTGADPATDFAKGALATHADFSDYWVDDCRIARSKSAQRVDVSLTNIGIS